MTTRSKYVLGATLLSTLLLAAVAYALPPKTDTDFTDNGDGTVTDKTTGLMWQQQDDGTTRSSWNVALQYCAGLNLGGQTDWRLPNIKELTSVVDPARSNPATFPVFHGVKAAYASSTRRSSTYWCVLSYDGSVDYVGRLFTGTCGGTYAPHTRCVRGGR